jgi:glycerol-3-phosphate O-acyltransferase/dihydroxyacetone phosphate acyltransferase
MGRGRAASLLAFRTLLLIVFIVCIAPMAILGLPLLIPRWYAARRARQAVASSSVKLEGRDVLATWKLMIALVLIPLMWIGYTAVVCAWSPAWGLPAPWDYEAGLLFFFFSPFFFYGAVLAGDRMALVARSLAPLATVILYPEARWALVEQRRELMQAMQVRREGPGGGRFSCG